MLVDLFIDPDGFFERAATDDGLVKPATVVLILGITGALTTLPFLRATVAALPREAGALAVVPYVFGLGGALLGPFVIWGLYAGAFHVISNLVYDARGSFKRTLAVTAWGFVPAIFAGIVSSVLTFLALQSVTLPTDPEQAAGFARRLQNDPLLQLAGVLGIAFLLWQGFLWTFAVRHARGIDLREAAVTVAVPVGVALVFRLYGLV